MSEFETQGPPPEATGLHPETGLYHIDHMPLPEDPGLRAAREKQLAGEPLTIGEALRIRGDTTFTHLDGIETKPDHMYRTVDQNGLDAYQEAGAVVGQGEYDEFKEGENNNGVDWYLGGVATKYGDIILEMPAYPDYAEPALHLGASMAKDPMVRHMKTSGTLNPVPMEHITVYHQNEQGVYEPRT